MGDIVENLQAQEGPVQVATAGEPGTETPALTPQAVTIQDRLHRLIEPWPKVPEDYANDLETTLINQIPDAAEAQLGESVSLCIDAMFGGGGHGQWPIMHLAKSGFKFVKIKQTKSKHAKVVPEKVRPKR